MESDIEVQLFGEGTDDVCGDEEYRGLERIRYIDVAANETE